MSRLHAPSGRVNPTPPRETPTTWPRNSSAIGLPVGREREFLNDFGFELRETLTVGGEESLKRYLTRADGTEIGAQAIAEAMARMSARIRAAGSEGAQLPAERTPEQQRLMTYQLAEAVVASSSIV